MLSKTRSHVRCVRRKQVRLPYVIPATTLILLFGCTDASGPSHAERGFGSIHPGQTTDAEVMELMGEPERKTVHNIGGLEMQIWEFEDAKANYTLTFGGAAFAGVGPRVVAKDLVPKSPR